jgi:hypothetical protein
MGRQVADLLGGARVLGASIKSNLDLAHATRQGLPAETAVQLFEALRGSDVVVGAAQPRQRRRRGTNIVAEELDEEAIGLAEMGPLGTLIGSLRHNQSRRKTNEGEANASPVRLTAEQSDIVI